MSDKLVVIVKLANQSSKDQRIECDSDWNVSLLKERIFELHPLKPAVCDQKLIYSGQLLQDSHLLKSSLRHPNTDDNEFILHMVCSTANNVNSDSNILKSDGSDSNEFFPEIRRRAVPESRNFEQPPSGFSVPAGGHLSAAPVHIQQYEAMQNLYAQYMTAYFQYVQTGYMPAVGPVVEVPLVSTPAGGFGNNAQPELGQANYAAPVPAPAGDAAAVEAPGAEEEEGGFEFRDWLDYLYFGTRLAVLLSIVFFYSTFSRFAYVFLVIVFVFLYQSGSFRFQRRADAVRPPAEGARREDPRGEGGEEAPAQRDASSDGSPRPGSEPPTPESQPAEPEHASLIALSWTFFTTFFSSLIPDHQ